MRAMLVMPRYYSCRLHLILDTGGLANETGDKRVHVLAALAKDDRGYGAPCGLLSCCGLVARRASRGLVGALPVSALES